jgi:integrase
LPDRGDRTHGGDLLRLDRLEVVNEVIHTQGRDVLICRERADHGTPDRHILARQITDEITTATSRLLVCRAERKANTSDAPRSDRHAHRGRRLFLVHQAAGCRRRGRAGSDERSSEWHRPRSAQVVTCPAFDREHRRSCSIGSAQPSARAITAGTIQELLGHRDVATTMIYTRVLNRGAGGVRSSLDE